MTTRNWMYTALFIIIGILFIAIYTYHENSDLDKNAKFTVGKIYDFYIDTKGHHNVLYTFTVQAKIYNDITMKATFTDCEKDRKCIGKCYEVQYSSKNPENSTMNFDKPCNCDSLNVDIH